MNNWTLSEVSEGFWRHTWHLRGEGVQAVNGAVTAGFPACSERFLPGQPLMQDTIHCSGS